MKKSLPPQDSPGPSLWPPRPPIATGHSEPTPPELSLDSLNHGYSGLTPRQLFGPGLSPASVRQPTPGHHLPSSPAAYQGQLSDTPLRRQLLQSPYAYLQSPYAYQHSPYTFLHSTYDARRAL